MSKANMEASSERGSFKRGGRGARGPKRGRGQNGFRGRGRGGGGGPGDGRGRGAPGGGRGPPRGGRGRLGSGRGRPGGGRGQRRGGRGQFGGGRGQFGGGRGQLGGGRGQLGGGRGQLGGGRGQLGDGHAQLGAGRGQLKDGRRQQKGGRGKGRSPNVKPQDVVRKQKLVPEDTHKAIYITNLPEKVEKLHHEFENFIAQRVGAVKLLFYQKITSINSCVMSATCVFEKPSDFCIAMEKLHGEEFHGNHLLVQKFMNSNSNEQLITRHCVCVTNLPKETSEEVLWDTFKSCGKLGMIYLDRSVISRTTLEALVNFEKSDSVINSLNLDGTVIAQSKINVVNLDWKLSIKISNFPKQTTSKDLEALIKDYNPIFFRISQKKKKRNSAFATFSDKESYSGALTLNGKDFRGLSIVVKPAVEHNVYMLIPNETSKAEVSKVLQPFGTVIDFKKDEVSGIKKISFKSKKEVAAALKAATVLIKGKFVEIWDLDSKVKYLWQTNDADGNEVKSEDDGSGMEELQDETGEGNTKKEEEETENEEEITEDEEGEGETGDGEGEEETGDEEGEEETGDEEDEEDGEGEKEMDDDDGEHEEDDDIDDDRDDKEISRKMSKPYNVEVLNGIPSPPTDRKRKRNDTHKSLKKMSKLT